jgi:DnaJ-domain-containing protein 1
MQARNSDFAQALEHERRRVIAEKDARILARTGSDPELARLAEHAAARLVAALDASGEPSPT